MHTSTGRKIVLLERTTPLSCSEARRRQNVEVVRRKGRPDVWAVAVATILTASAFSILCAYLLYRAKVDYSPYVYYKHVTLSMLGYPRLLEELSLAAFLFIIAYPLVGLMVMFLCGGLASVITRVYEFEPGKRWHASALLIFASSWPITGWSIPLLVFALVLGVIYKPLWGFARKRIVRVVKRQGEAAIRGC